MTSTPSPMPTRRLRKSPLTRPGVLAVVATCLAVAVFPRVTGIAGDPEPDVFSRSRVYKTPIVSACSSDTCTTTLPADLKTTMPVGLGLADVHVQLSVEYRTTPRDAAEVVMRSEAPGEPRVLALPGPLRLRPGSLTESTLAWVVRNVDPAAGEHVFSWRLRPADGDAQYVLKATRAS